MTNHMQQFWKRKVKHLYCLSFPVCAQLYTIWWVFFVRRVLFMIFVVEWKPWKFSSQKICIHMDCLGVRSLCILVVLWYVGTFQLFQLGQIPTTEDSLSSSVKPGAIHAALCVQTAQIKEVKFIQQTQERAFDRSSVYGYDYRAVLAGFKLTGFCMLNLVSTTNIDRNLSIAHVYPHTSKEQWLASMPLTYSIWN